MTSEYRYGIVSGAALSAWVLTEFALGFHSTSLHVGQYSGYFSVVIPLVVIGVALHEYHRAGNGNVSFKGELNTGFTVAVISALVFTLFMIVYQLVINPGWTESLVEWERTSLIIGGATDDEIGRFMEHHRNRNSLLGQSMVRFISITGLGVFFTIVLIPLVRFISRNHKAARS